MSILQSIHTHDDLVALNEAQRIDLCGEIREFLVQHISKTGGHLASNLGVVELTVAIETVFNTEIDRLVFDVGHQSYVHKLLTGRQAEFASLRQFGGMAGFPKPGESQTDAFVAGHASSSISIALGMARARTMTGQNYNVLALIGDGATTGGMAYEGLNDAAVSKEPLIVILNDNKMSIDNNVGGMASHLSKIRTKKKYLILKRRYKNVLSKIPGGDWVFRVTRNMKNILRRMFLPETIFESIGFEYLGPVDGHNVENLISLLQIARDAKRPVVLHVLTKKGRGYAPAQEHPKLFHGVGKFDPTTGQVESTGIKTFSDTFGQTMLALAAGNERLCAITAAMPGGTGLLDFKKLYPKRTLDVGIAEEHAVSMAGGLSKQGMTPVVAIYSTFLQRAYDQILQDVAMLGLHVIFAVDRAGLVGEDGETHHGVFDVGYLRQVPGMSILCPASRAELQTMLTWAVNICNGPVAIRYPRGGDREYIGTAWSGLHSGVCCHRKGRGVAIITYGTMLQNAMDAAAKLELEGIHITVLRLLTVAPLPVSQILEYLQDIHHIIVVEETCAGSGIREALSWELSQCNADVSVSGMDLGCDFVTHGSVNMLYKHYGLDADGISSRVRGVLKVENKEKTGCASS